MALPSTLHNIRIALSDTDRGVYETFELRVARHPSEAVPYMLARVLAYCLFWEPDIAFSKGLSTPDEPALWIRTLDGRVKLWIEIGRPGPDRLHKASKAAERVVVCTYPDSRLLLRALDGANIHRAETIEIVAFSGSLLDALEGHVAKRMNWEVLVTGGELYVTTGGATIAEPVARQALVAA